MTTEIIIAGIIIMLASLSGKLLAFGAMRKSIQKNLRFLVSFAMGVFVATLLTIFDEIAQIAPNIPLTIAIAALGAVGLELVSRFLPDAHHHHGTDKKECCEHSCAKSSITTQNPQIAQINKSKKYTKTHKINPHRILLGDAFHNISDGIILVPAFLISIPTGITVTIGIVLHEIVQEISEFFLLKEAGYSTTRALLSNFAVSSTVFIGIAISLMVSSATDYTYLLLSLAAGSLIWIISRDLLPHTITRIRHSGNIATHATAFTLGLITIYAVTHLHI